jgi:hypothetical protein
MVRVRIIIVSQAGHNSRVFMHAEQPQQPASRASQNQIMKQRQRSQPDTATYRGKYSNAAHIRQQNQSQPEPGFIPVIPGSGCRLFSLLPV